MSERNAGLLPSKRVLDDLKDMLGEGENQVIKGLRDLVASEIRWYEGNLSEPSFGSVTSIAADRLHAYYIVMDKIEFLTGEKTVGDRTRRDAWHAKPKESAI